MEKYQYFRPTEFDPAGAFLPERHEWLVVPCGRTRDSDPLAESNFASALKALGGESETVEVHRFGHWGPGWFEIIIVDPASPQKEIAEGIEAKLADYPILNEDDFSEREWAEATEVWKHCFNLKERVKLCAEAGVSIFAARHEWIPQEDNGRIFERCTR